MHANLGLYADTGEVLAKPMRRITTELLECGNRYIGYIRQQPAFPDAYSQTDDFRETLAYLQRYMQERGIDPDAPAFVTPSRPGGG